MRHSLTVWASATALLLLPLSPRAAGAQTAAPELWSMQPPVRPLLDRMPAAPCAAPAARPRGPRVALPDGPGSVALAADFAPDTAWRAGTAAGRWTRHARRWAAPDGRSLIIVRDTPEALSDGIFAPWSYLTSTFQDSSGTMIVASVSDRLELTERCQTRLAGHRAWLGLGHRAEADHWLLVAVVELARDQHLAFEGRGHGAQARDEVLAAIHSVALP